MTGRYLNEHLGRISFWLVFIGVQMTFGAMFLSGLKGMPRRVASYSLAFEHTNFISTIGAYIIMAGMLVLLGAIITSWHQGRTRRSQPLASELARVAGADARAARELRILPVVTEDPYSYGEELVRS